MGKDRLHTTKINLWTALIVCLATLLPWCPLVAAPTVVTVRPGDQRIFVQERKSDGTLGQPYTFVVKGVNWSPASIGTDPTSNPQAYQQDFFNWYQTDIPLMAAMGINVVRLYHDPGTGTNAFGVLDMFYQYGIKVIMPVDSPLQGQSAVTSNIATVVNAYKNHPAILMWSVGNEWDINRYYGVFTNLQLAAQFTEQAALLIKSLDTNHPVATFYGDPHIPLSTPDPTYGSYHYLSLDTTPWAAPMNYLSSIIVSNWVPDVDVWGLNIYRGSSFMDVFAQWQSISTKPMLIGEYGADSFDHSIMAENQSMQSNFDCGLWDEVYFNLAPERTNGIASGGLVFEWNDEWWKNGNPSNRDHSTEINYGQPDGYNDEEWFGIVNIARNPKQAYYAFQTLYAPNGQSSIPLATNPVLTAVSSQGGPAKFLISTNVVYSRAGGDLGARGFNVAVLDEQTGIRMKDYRHFDTYYDPSKFAAITNYLSGLPNGSIVLFAICDDSGLTIWPAQAEAVTSMLASWGSTMITNVGFQQTWAMIAKKGQGVLGENWSSIKSDVTIQATLPLSVNANANRRQSLIQVAPFGITQARYLTNNTFQVSFQSQDAVVYSVEYRNDLTTGSWLLAQRGIVADGTNCFWIDDGSFTGGVQANVQRRFYRIVAVDQVSRP
jgi:hypothetical protein